MRDFLTKSQRVQIALAHRQERDGKIRDRMKAVLLADRGEAMADIAKFLLADEQTVRRHVKDYFDNDKFGGGSGGSQGKLDEGQAERLKELLAACDVPTAAEAAERAKGLFGARFSASGMADWLKRMGFSYKKSQPLPAKADAGDQDAWIQAYRELKALVLPCEPILFLDAAHPSMATRLGYGWSLKGQRKLVKTSSGKTRVNVLGSLEPETMIMTASFPKTVDGDAIAEHFELLRKAFPAESYSTLHVILDNGSYNRSKATLEHAQALGIELHFLPPYSPNLNLIERAWRLMSEQVRDNVFFESHAAFEAAIKDFFKTRWRRLAKTRKALFADNFQVFGPAF